MRRNIKVGIVSIVIDYDMNFQTKSSSNRVCCVYCVCVVCEIKRAVPYL